MSEASEITQTQPKEVVGVILAHIVKTLSSKSKLRSLMGPITFQLQMVPLRIPQFQLLRIAINTLLLNFSFLCMHIILYMHILVYNIIYLEE